MRRLLIFLALSLGLAAGYVVWIWTTLPDPSPLRKANPQTTSFIQRYCEKGDCPIEWRSLKEISRFVPQAVILAEDVRFLRHSGVDWRSLWAALKLNLKERRIVWGASTITQQLAKNLYLGSEKRLGRKLRELFLTYRLEKEIGKERILEIYLNVAQWGPSLFGITAASRHYFQKEPDELGPLEASYLASILPNPEHADEPAWRERFAETGGRLFDILAQTYLPPVNHEASSTVCTKSLEPGQIQTNDYIVAKIFGAYANEIVSGQAALIKQDDLDALLDADERKYIEGLFEEARSLGAPAKIRCRNDSPSPERLVPLSQPSPLYGKRTYWIPEKAWPALNDILRQAKEEGVSLVVNSAYRDKGYQTYLFLAMLRQSRYCLSQTARDVALPEASEHGCLDTPAIDFGALGEERPFEDTEAFRWLEREAPKRGFEMSFPRENGRMSYEPWHWRYKSASRLPLAPSIGDQHSP